MASKNTVYLTEEGLKDLKAELDNLINVRRPVINDIPKDIVGLGSTVAIKYIDDDDEDEYKIVGSQEADPFESKISNESPIAKALLNHKVGDVVTVESPNGNYEIEITEIK